jgi:hypothetical protein
MKLSAENPRLRKAAKCSLFFCHSFTNHYIWHSLYPNKSSFAQKISKALKNQSNQSNP